MPRVLYCKINLPQKNFEFKFPFLSVSIYKYEVHLTPSNVKTQFGLDPYIWVEEKYENVIFTR